MAGPDDYIRLPEMNLGRLPQRRRRPRPVVDMDEPEAGPALTTELRERDDIPNPRAATPDNLSGIDDQLGRMRSQLGLAPQTTVPAVARAPVVAGMDEEDPVANPTEIGEPSSAEQMEGQSALGAIPRTQLRAPQVAPRPQSGPRGARYGMPVVAGMDDIEAEPVEENAAGLTRPQTGMVAGMDDGFEQDFAPTQPKQAPARAVPGVRNDAALDERDRERMRRMNIAQGIAAGGMGLAGIIGAARDTNQHASQYNMENIMGGDALMSAGPAANIARREQQRRYNQGLQFDLQDRAFRRDQAQFTRENALRRAGLDERRIQQAVGATDAINRRTSAEYDADSTSAQGLRDAYDAMIDGLPEEAAQVMRPWVDLNTDGFNADAMKNVLDRLQATIAAERHSNPRAFRQGQRGGGSRRARRGDPMAGLGGSTTRGHTNYGYGVNARTEAMGDEIDPETGETLPQQPLEAAQQPAQAIERGEPPPRVQAMPGAPRAQGVAARPTRGQPRSAVPPPEVANDPEALAQWTIGQATGQRAGQPQPPQGQAILDRDVTPEEWRGLSANERTTVSAARAYMRAHPGTPWDVASVNVNGLNDTSRSELIRDWGNPNVDLVPGFRYVTDTGRLTPQRMEDVRNYANQANQAAALSSEMLGLIDRVSALNLAEGAMTGNPLVQEMLGKARRLQTLLRVVDRTGVPTGTEQQRAMQEAPEPLNPLEIIRARSAYAAYPRSILSMSYRNLRGEGFLPINPAERQGR